MDNDLLSRFLDDRQSVSTADLDRLIAEIQADPDARRRFRELLQFDDLIGRSLAPDRADFARQVKQRLLDLQRRGEAGVTEFEQAVLRRTVREPASRARWLAPLLAAAAVLLVVAGAWWANIRPEPAPAVRLTVQSVKGLVTHVRDGEGLGPVKAGLVLAAGDSLSTPTNGTVVLAYEGEATRITVGGGTTLQVRGGRGDPAGIGKRFLLHHGSLEGTIAAQPAGSPMIFDTPLARATVLGTRLRLTSDPRRSSVDVEEGNVRFAALAGGREILVAAGQQGVVRADGSTPTVYGEILFAEDFEGDLRNWVILKEYGEEAAVMDTNVLSRVRIEKRTDGAPGHWLVIDARNLGEDVWIAVRARNLFDRPAVRVSMEHIGLDPGAHSHFNFTVFAPGGKLIQERRHLVHGQIGVLLKSDTAWQQRVVEGGCEAYVFFSLTGKPMYEEKIFYKGVDKVQPWLAINISDCMFKADKIVVRTMEPMEAPDLPKVVRPESTSGLSPAR